MGLGVVLGGGEVGGVAVHSGGGGSGEEGGASGGGAPGVRVDDAGVVVDGLWLNRGLRDAG